MPILLVFTILLVIRGITLPGAAQGLDYLFSPNWDALKKSDVWIAAYSQVFYSLSIAFAIMISYASYLPKKTDVVNSAFLTATANHGKQWRRTQEEGPLFFLRQEPERGAQAHRRVERVYMY